MSDANTVTIFTDGACHGNPGPGGYAALLIHPGKSREISGGYRETTNNRMELMAAIEGLRALKKPCKVTLYSDSRYLVQSISEGWVQRWRANGWKRNKKDYAQNVDLWQQLLDLCEKHDVEFKWTKGHAGHPENERCDVLANEAAGKANLPVDTGFGKEIQSGLF